MLIEEIVVRVENDGLDLVIRWAGDDHIALRVRKNRTGQHRWGVDAGVVEFVRAMARRMPDPAIAAVLNRTGMSTGKANSWTRSRVASLRNHYDIAVYREGERAERGEATLDEAADALAVSPGRTARSRCGSLYLHRSGLAPPTCRRALPAHHRGRDAHC